MLISGASAGASIIFPHVWPLSLVALVPLLCLISTSSPSRRVQVFVLGIAWGFGLMGVSLSFAFAMLPFDWLGISSAAAGFALACALWFFFSLSLALPVGVFALLIHVLQGIKAVFLVPTAVLVWVCCEILRATLHSVVALGPGTPVGPYFSFGFLGYALAWADGLLPLARLGGVFFLSTFAILINVCVWIVLRNKMRVRTSLGVCGGVVLLFIAINALLPQQQAVVLGAEAAFVAGEEALLIHTNEPARFSVAAPHSTAAADTLANVITDALSSHQAARIVILPEDRRFIESIVSPETSAEKTALAALQQRRALLIDSARLGKNREVRGALYAYDFSTRTPVGFSLKHYLVPGEYIPYVVAVSAQLFGFSENIERVREARASYQAGTWDSRQRIFNWQGMRIGVLSCSELFAPLLMHDIAKRDADVIVLVSSQSWTPGGSKVLFNQMLAMAKTGAMWAQLPYLQATNVAQNIVITTVGQ